MAEAAAPTVFVSYSHKDKKHLEKVLPFLEQLELNEHIELWTDRDLGVGEDWYRELDHRMRNAKVAILLVTQNFLASAFCKREEVPVLLQRHREGELAIFPLFVRDCHWQDEPWLKRLQMIPGDKPLNRQGKKRDAVLTELAQSVKEIAVGGVEPPRTALKEWPQDSYDVSRLPETGSLLFGRRSELDLLDQAWASRESNVVVFTAGGGVGKSTLCRVWAQMLAEDDWRGGLRAYAWSFYSQGTDRMGSSDAFISAAFDWFDEPLPPTLSPWDRGARLAELVREQRMLLILDGVEPLQSGSVADRGELKDPALKTLLEDLADENPGLCLVSTREPMTDLVAYESPAVVQHDLERVSLVAGRALMRVAGVRGSDEAIEAVVESVEGHALAVNLLASYIADTETRRIEIAGEIPHPDPRWEPHEHPRRVLEAWADRLGASPELNVLNQLGLFDRPAKAAELKALRETELVDGLNDELNSESFVSATAELRRLRLVAPGRASASGIVDCHPLVREHFGERLAQARPIASTAGHRILYKHLASTTTHQPDTLEGLAPLYAAVTHGCAANLHQQALDVTYYERINRRGEKYAVVKLGATGANLSAISSFFEQPWHTPTQMVEPHDQAYVLGEAAYELRALGRLEMAIEAAAAGLERRIKLKDWTNAAAVSGTISELEMAAGNISRARNYAKQGVDYADSSGDTFHSLLLRAKLATVHHQAGELDAAMELFESAERLQADLQPQYPKMYSYQGYLFCELLLDMQQAEQVVPRAEQAKNLAIEDRQLFEIGLFDLLLGRAHLQLDDKAESSTHLEDAVAGLRLAGQQNLLPQALLGRAELHIVCDTLAASRADLDESMKLCTRMGLRLLEADTHLLYTRLYLAEGDPHEASASISMARTIIDDTGYDRRRAELDRLTEQLRD